jgi:hypothetical protein
MKALLMLLCAIVPFALHAEGKMRYDGAHIRLERTECDFGEIDRKGENKVLTFRYENDGSEPLVLFAAVTTCPCLRAEFSRKPVAVGQGGEIKIVVESKRAEQGIFRRVVQLRSNSVGGTEIITIEGNVK